VDTNAILTFQRDAAGDVSGVTLKQGSRTREGTKVDVIRRLLEETR
jgi:hypothetical protein